MAHAISGSIESEPNWLRVIPSGQRPLKPPLPRSVAQPFANYLANAISPIVLVGPPGGGKTLGAEYHARFAALQRLQEMGERGRRRVEERFSVEGSSNGSSLAERFAEPYVVSLNPATEVTELIGRRDPLTVLEHRKAGLDIGEQARKTPHYGYALGALGQGLTRGNTCIVNEADRNLDFQAVVIEITSGVLRLPPSPELAPGVRVADTLPVDPHAVLVLCINGQFDTDTVLFSGAWTRRGRFIVVPDAAEAYYPSRAESNSTRDVAGESLSRIELETSFARSLSAELEIAEFTVQRERERAFRLASIDDFFSTRAERLEALRFDPLVPAVAAILRAIAQLRLDLGEDDYIGSSSAAAFLADVIVCEDANQLLLHTNAARAARHMASLYVPTLVKSAAQAWARERLAHLLARSLEDAS